ncbi:hypothetical protein CLOBOL_03420 [Enterocloster bolteae ATCC BAA-613]|uniref:Uncharacterized protein n=1 Tax=Enterocloster bolteae (strain ATCC BAA-613 / DSM 15670 / CCUG 46953 / JCM 12243 / WAL 16351) TaxID=411902 RepID=A8RSS1_ENTBW|nr:hypothetical protein CLOBOL_03420 [Enterocloster bolteae ATCC BAA-613]
MIISKFSFYTFSVGVHTNFQLGIPVLAKGEFGTTAVQMMGIS